MDPETLVDELYLMVCRLQEETDLRDPDAVLALVDEIRVKLDDLCGWIQSGGFWNV
jgi:hypothetical protein